MPLEDREWYRTYRQWNRKRSRSVRLVRRASAGLAARSLKLLLVAVLLGYVAVAFVHLTNGMKFRTSFGAAFQDARLAMTCPMNLGRQWEFIDRSQIEQIALGRYLNRGDHVYKDICFADQFPLQGWSQSQTDALASKEGTTAPTPSAVPPFKPARIPTISPGQTPSDPIIPLIPIAIPYPSPTPTVALTDAVPPSLTSIPLADLKNYLLGLINHDRQANGLGPVTLGGNPAAQEHAEEMLAHSYLSHWDLDGMKPYMRYTLAGGVNYEAENASGISTPSRPGLNYRTISPKEELQKTQRGFMESRGHRRNIVNPLHKKVNLGIACNRTTCAVVQQFAGEYVKFSERPAMTDGVLSMAGQLAGGFEIVGIQVWYDPPPHPLTLGQLDRTYCYDAGTSPAAFIREPLPPGTSYLPDSDPYTWDKCLNPYDVLPDTPRLQPGFAVPEISLVGSSNSPWVTARSWNVAGGSFRVEADLAGVVANYGAGVFTVLVWGNAGGKDMALTRYSIFVE